MYLLRIAADVRIVVVDIDTVEISRNLLQRIVGPTAATRTHRRIHMVSAARQIGAVHVSDGVLGLLHEGEVVRFGAAPALPIVIGLVVNFIIVHAIVVADIQPVDSRKDMFPPLVPTRSCVWWI